MTVFAPTLGAMWKQLEGYGLDPDPVFREAGVNPSMMFDPGARIATDRQQQLLSIAAERSGEDPLQAGRLLGRREDAAVHQHDAVNGKSKRALVLPGDELLAPVDDPAESQSELLEQQHPQVGTALDQRAERLAVELGGELRDQQQCVLTHQALMQLREKIVEDRLHRRSAS